jgi:hypothetical protein
MDAPRLAVISTEAGVICLNLVAHHRAACGHDPSPLSCEGNFAGGKKGQKDSLNILLPMPKAITTLEGQF